MTNIQRAGAWTKSKNIFITLLLSMAVVFSSLSPHQRDVGFTSIHSAKRAIEKNVYAVVRVDANRDMLATIRKSLVREGFEAEFTNLEYNEKGLLTSIRMVVKQGDRIIGDISEMNGLSDRPLVFYCLAGKKMGLTVGFPKDLPAGDRKKLNFLHGVMVTDRDKLEVHGTYKYDN